MDEAKRVFFTTVDDAPIEARHHAIGLGVTWWRQTMLYAHPGVADIKHMHVCGAFIFADKAIRELTPIARWTLLYTH